MADINETIDNEIARGDMETVPQKKREVRTDVPDEGDSKIPVSKAHGSLWKSRRNQALSQRKYREL